MRWLLCDYGEVLSKAQPPASRQALVATSGCAETAFWRRYWENRGAYDRADLTPTEYWSRILGDEPTESVVRALTAEDIASWLSLNEESVAAARRAGERGYRLAVLSNAPAPVADMIDQLPALAEFQPRLFSCRLGEIKPNEAIFRKTLNCLQASPDEVVFFDDRQINVEASLALGMVAHLFTEASQFDELPAVR